MKTKTKEKKKNKKRSEFLPGFELGTSAHRAKALPLDHVENTKNMNSKILFRRMTAVWTVKTQRKCISSHLHVKNGSPTV